MDEKNKEVLNQKRIQLQLSLEAKKYYSYYLKDWVHLYASWIQNSIHLQVVYLCIVEQTYIPSLFKIIESEQLLSSLARLDLIKTDEAQNIVKQLQLYFPSKNLLSYVPQLQTIGNYYDDPSSLHKYLNEKYDGDLLVYVVYSRFAPVILLTLQDFLTHYPKFNTDDYYDEIMVFPANYDWLLLCSFDDTWKHGKRLEGLS